MKFKEYLDQYVKEVLDLPTVGDIVQYNGTTYRILDVIPGSNTVDLTPVRRNDGADLPGVPAQDLKLISKAGETTEDDV